MVKFIYMGGNKWFFSSNLAQFVLYIGQAPKSAFPYILQLSSFQWGGGRSPSFRLFFFAQMALFQFTWVVLEVMAAGANIVRIRLFLMPAWVAGSEEAGRAKMFERPAP